MKFIWQKNKMDLNIRKMTKHPPSPEEPAVSHSDNWQKLAINTHRKASAVVPEIISWLLLQVIIQG